MKRRSFFSLLSSLPFLGFLATSPSCAFEVEASPKLRYVEVDTSEMPNEFAIIRKDGVTFLKKMRHGKFSAHTVQLEHEGTWYTYRDCMISDGPIAYQCPDGKTVAISRNHLR